MALSPSTAKSAARAKIESSFGPIDPNLKPSETASIDASRDQLAESIASMSAYIQQNAQVIATVASVSGVTPGGGASGPGSATGTLL